jgi:hypothetical protein
MDLETKGPTVRNCLVAEASEPASRMSILNENGCVRSASHMAQDSGDWAEAIIEVLRMTLA